MFFLLFGRGILMGVTDFLNPDGIAIIGASKTAGKLGNDAMTNIRSYDGDVYPVNPSGSGSVYGYDFVDSVAETDADLALCCVPSSVVPEVLESLASPKGGRYHTLGEITHEKRQSNCIRIHNREAMSSQNTNTGDTTHTPNLPDEMSDSERLIIWKGR
jgi:predicted CoA-binding protein